MTPEEEEPSEPADEEPVEAEEPAEPEATEPAVPEQPPIHEVTFEEDGAKKGVQSIQDKMKRKPYKERHYLLYGFEDVPKGISASATHTYLRAKGFDRNPLKQARDGRNIAEELEKNYQPNKPGVRYCDFCGAELTGVEYETLKDGRDRCITCSRTAVKTAEEFRELFDDVRIKMREFYGVNINVSIKVEMVNARKLHKKLGHSFVPTPAPDGRILGVAIHDRNGFTVMVENGSPRMKTIATMAHELTHIWQYLNWDRKMIQKKYGNLEQQVYEGMAKWAEIQYLYLIGEPIVGKRNEIHEAMRNDEYGYGLLRFMANYPISESTTPPADMPFMHVDTPLAPEYCAGIPQLII